MARQQIQASEPSPEPAAQLAEALQDREPFCRSQQPSVRLPFFRATQTSRRPSGSPGHDRRRPAPHNRDKSTDDPATARRRSVPTAARPAIATREARRPLRAKNPSGETGDRDSRMTKHGMHRPRPSEQFRRSGTNFGRGTATPTTAPCRRQLSANSIARNHATPDPDRSPNKHGQAWPCADRTAAGCANEPRIDRRDGEGRRRTAG